MRFPSEPSTESPSGGFMPILEGDRCPAASLAEDRSETRDQLCARQMPMTQPETFREFPASSIFEE